MISTVIEVAYWRGIRELTAKLDKDFGDFLHECQQRHADGAARMKKPTLSLRADTSEDGQLSIQLRFDKKGARGRKAQIAHTFPGANYEEVAEMTTKLRPLLCRPEVVSWFVQSARPRLEAKHFGGAA
ncbi:hypothetical protein NN6n1_35500 [Shinella zoogloeoides]